VYYKEYLSLENKLKSGCINGQDYKMSVRNLLNRIIVEIQENNINGNVKAVKDIYNDVKNINVPAEVKKRFDNIMLNELEIAERKVFLKSKMRILYCAVTSLCNVKCIMCQIVKNKWELPEHAVDEIIAAMPYLENVIWQGGEVFLYKHFERLMDEAGKYNVNQEIGTNGLLLNERIIKKLITYNVDLGISIDGLTKEVYEYIRAGADFDLLISNLRMLKKIKSDFSSQKTNWHLNVLVMKKNLNQIEYFPEFAKEHGFAKLCINSFGPAFDSKEENIFHYNKSREFELKIIDIKKKINRKCRDFGIELFDSLPDFETLNNNSDALRAKDENNAKLSGNSHEIPKEALFCQVPWRRIFIDSDGSIRPECFCDRKYSIGNIASDRIEDVWNNEFMQRYRECIINGANHNLCKSDCLERRIPEKVLNYVVNPNLFWWDI
jgi:MoaA/NifB/PqqE/SkfB family radical SAM enzyme